MISLLNDSLDESQVHDSVLRSENQRDKPQLSNFLCRSVCGDVCLAASVFESFCVFPVECLCRRENHRRGFHVANHRDKSFLSLSLTS